MTKADTKHLPGKVRAALNKLAAAGIAPEELAIMADDALVRVPGMGPATLGALREHFPFDEAGAFKALSHSNRSLSAQVERLSRVLQEQPAEPVDCGAFHAVRSARIEMRSRREGAVLLSHGRPETRTCLRFKLDLDGRLPRNLASLGFGETPLAPWPEDKGFFLLRGVKTVRMSALKRVSDVSFAVLSFELARAVLRFELFAEGPGAPRA